MKASVQWFTRQTFKRKKFFNKKFWKRLQNYLWNVADGCTRGVKIENLTKILLQGNTSMPTKSHQVQSCFIRNRRTQYRVFFYTISKIWLLISALKKLKLLNGMIYASLNVEISLLWVTANENISFFFSYISVLHSTEIIFFFKALRKGY